MSYPLWPPEGGRVLRFNNGKAQMSPKEKHLHKVKGRFPKDGWSKGREMGLWGTKREEGRVVAGTGTALDPSLSFRDCYVCIMRRGWQNK